MRGLSLIGLFAALGIAYGLSAQPVHAEGSVNLIANGGYRPFLLQANATEFGISTRGVFKVYADVGEMINLGSSANGLGAGVIRYRPPTGGAFLTCPTVGTTGRILSRTQENIGPNPGGYDPCVVAVGAGQAGVWEIEFLSPNPTDNSNPPRTQIATDNWDLTIPTPNAQPNNVRWIRAWDITVKRAGITQPGRAYADYLSMTIGSNVTGSPVLRSSVYILSEDGYVYEINMNGVDPFTFTFLSNNKGFRDINGDAIYRSLQFDGPGLLGNIPAGYSLHNPGNPDNPATNDYTHKIFFQLPDFANLPVTAPSPDGMVNLDVPPVIPPIPSGLTFTGIEGTPGRAGTAPLGGNFTFTSPAVGPYAIVLDLNNDGTYGNGNDRIMTGTARVGNNTVYWDGLDQFSNPVPAGTIPYNSEVTMFAGEVHFPFLDPENNRQGIQIRRIRDPGTTLNPTDVYTIYYNDTYNPGTLYDYSLCASGETPPSPAGCYGTPPVPRSALGGVSSLGGGHAYSNDFGNRRGMDTWVYYPSDPFETFGTLILAEADLATVKTDVVDPILVNSPVTYTITVNNFGPSDAPGATFTDNFPAYLTNVTWSCVPSPGAACTPNGVGNINDIVDIPNGGSLVYTVTALPVGAPNPFTNSATITRPPDITDPNLANNTDSEDTSYGAASPVPPPPTGEPNVITSLAITKSAAPPFAGAGAEVLWTITVTNIGSAPASGVIVRDTLPNELIIITAWATAGVPSISGQVVTLNATLNPGETIVLTVQTRIRPGVTPPFVIKNEASAALSGNGNGSQAGAGGVGFDAVTAEASVIGASHLPGTGESPRARWLLIGTVGLLLGYWLWKLIRGQLS